MTPCVYQQWRQQATTSHHARAWQSVTLTEFIHWKAAAPTHPAAVHLHCTQGGPLFHINLLDLLPARRLDYHTSQTEATAAVHFMQLRHGAPHTHERPPEGTHR
ncbi:hypothetical protein V5799_028880 [Amblyomma americanum]|uniref:Uncharacterized protein n=1 Tax=Amblyomma americanum TaxID=6943 RepID=A0AAQ4DBM5_AMBAM